MSVATGETERQWGRRSVPLRANSYAEKDTSKYSPAEPGALGIGPLEAAVRVADATLHLGAT